MERRYGVRSVAEQQLALEKLEETTEVEQFSNPELRKRISLARKLRKNVTHQFADMAANEAEFERARERKAQLKAEVDAKKEKKTELLQQREALEAEFAAAKKSDDGEEIARLEEEIGDRRNRAADKTRQVVGILENFFKEADEFVRKAQKAADIDRHIDAILPPAQKQRKGH
jgi:hypothetical protein